MKVTNSTASIAWRIALITATLATGACDAVNEVANRGNDADTYYYVSLGTSLSVGVQPNGSGIPVPTDEGYPDQVFDSIRPAFEAGGNGRDLKLIRLGCPGETLDDMLNGGSCPYLAGSQLAAAVDFINDNKDRIHLITIDIGGNDFRDADCIGAVDYMNCATDVSTQIAMDLAVVLAALRQSADPNTTIVGMNYYNPYLGSWLEGDAGQQLAYDSSQAAAILMDYLSTTYESAGVPMADVYNAFASDDFGTMVPSSLPPPNDGMLPLNVANICEFTYMCDPDPVGPDIHASRAGYALIAETIEALLP